MTEWKGVTRVRRRFTSFSLFKEIFRWVGSRWLGTWAAHTPASLYGHEMSVINMVSAWQLPSWNCFRGKLTVEPGRSTCDNRNAEIVSFHHEAEMY